MTTDSERSPCNRGFLVKHKLLSIRQGLRKSWRYTFYIDASFCLTCHTIKSLSASRIDTYKRHCGSSKRQPQAKEARNMWPHERLKKQGKAAVREK